MRMIYLILLAALAACGKPSQSTREPWSEQQKAAMRTRCIDDATTAGKDRARAEAECSCMVEDLDKLLGIDNATYEQYVEISKRCGVIQ